MPLLLLLLLPSLLQFQCCCTSCACWCACFPQPTSPRCPAPPCSSLPAGCRFIDDEEVAYVITRARQVHDFWHVLFACHTNAFGEVALKALEFVQVGSSVVLRGCEAAAWRLLLGGWVPAGWQAWGTLLFGGLLWKRSVLSQHKLPWQTQPLKPTLSHTTRCCCCHAAAAAAMLLLLLLPCCRRGCR